MYREIALIGGEMVLTTGLWYDPVSIRLHHREKGRAEGLDKRGLGASFIPTSHPVLRSSKGIHTGSGSTGEPA